MLDKKRLRGEGRWFGNSLQQQEYQVILELYGGITVKILCKVMGMMTYSGGSACGKPVIHLGPVGMSQDIDSFKELFVTYGKRMGEQLLKVR